MIEENSNSKEFDRIGKYITEINITSPTGVQQIRNRLSTKISNELLKIIKKYHES